jgi:hypothetical protein
VLTKVLGEEEIRFVTTVELGGGSLLAEAPLDDVGFAIVVLPDVRHREPGFQALLVETGVVLGKGIPTLVLTNPGDSPPAALKSVPHAGIEPNDADALRMHVRLFARMADGPHPVTATLPKKVSAKPAVEDLEYQRQALLRTSGTDFEVLVFGLLKRSDVQVESEVRLAGDRGIDAVIGVPSPAGASLVVLVEVLRATKAAGAHLESASHQLLNFTASRRADLGLIITQEPVSRVAAEKLAPLILVMSAEELLDIVSKGSLARYLFNARNHAVHGV